MAEKDCGCEILEKANTFEVKIAYCPKHAAVDDLIAALRAAQEVIHLRFCQAGDRGGNKECWKECRTAQDAIRKSGG